MPVVLGVWVLVGLWMLGGLVLWERLWVRGAPITVLLVKGLSYQWPGGAHTLGGFLNNSDHTGMIGTCLFGSNVKTGAKLYGEAGYKRRDHDVMNGKALLLHRPGTPKTINFWPFKKPIMIITNPQW